MLGYVGQTTPAAADTFYPGYAKAMTDVGKERGWPPMTRASFDAQRGPDGALLIGSPDEVVDKILRHHEALGGVSRISFQMNVAWLQRADATAGSMTNRVALDARLCGSSKPRNCFTSRKQTSKDQRSAKVSRICAGVSVRSVEKKPSSRRRPRGRGPRRCAGVAARHWYTRARQLGTGAILRRGRLPGLFPFGGAVAAGRPRRGLPLAVQPDEDGHGPDLLRREGKRNVRGEDHPTVAKEKTGRYAVERRGS
jgi:hypothetical protein